MRNMRACVRQDALCYLRMHSVAWICLGRFWIEFFPSSLLSPVSALAAEAYARGKCEVAAAVTLTLIERSPQFTLASLKVKHFALATLKKR